MSEQKIYVGSGTSKFQGNLIDVSVCITDAESHIFDYKGKKYLKLCINAKKEPDQFGKTHSVSINTWKPAEQNNATPPPVKVQDVEIIEDSDLPF